jgi:hypothetical protein
MTILQRRTQLEQRKQTAKDIGFVMISAIEYISVWAVYMAIISRMFKL